jgi:hypothetical protein
MKYAENWRTSFDDSSLALLLQQARHRQRHRGAAAARSAVIKDYLVIEHPLGVCFIASNSPKTSIKK